MSCRNRVLSLVLAFVLLLSVILALPLLSYAGASFTDGVFSGKVLDPPFDHGVELNMYTGASTSVEVPAMLAGKPVLNINLMPIESNLKITSLNVSLCTQLQKLVCVGTNIQTLDLTQNSQLLVLTVKNNKLTSIKFPPHALANPQAFEIDVSGNNITDPATITALESFGIYQGAVANVVRPSIIGMARVGSTLTVSTGVWTPSPQSVSVMWYRTVGSNRVPVSTGSSYILTARDQGYRIDAEVTVGFFGYKPNSVVSVPVFILPGQFAKTPKPTISGKLKVGKTLKAKVAASVPAAEDRSYQWYRNGKKIPGAVKASYKLKKADKKKTISVAVKVYKMGYTPVTQVSKKTAKVK